MKKGEKEREKREIERKRERKEREKREIERNRKKKREKGRKRCPGSIIINLHSILKKKYIGRNARNLKKWPAGYTVGKYHDKSSCRS